MPLGVRALSGKSATDIRQQIARATLVQELARHPLIRAVFDDHGRTNGLYAASVAYTRAANAVAQALGYTGQAERQRAESAAAREMFGPSRREKGRPWPDAFQRGERHDGPVLRRAMDALKDAHGRRNRLVQKYGHTLDNDSPVVLAATRVAVELLGVTTSPRWMRRELSIKLKERFGYAAFLLELPTEVTIERPAPRVKLTTLPRESAAALQRRIRETLATVAAAQDGAQSERVPRSKQTSIARNVVWLCRHWLEGTPKDYLAQDYCEAEQKRGAQRHFPQEHWRNDRALVLKGISDAEKLLGLRRRENKTRK